MLHTFLVRAHKKNVNWRQAHEKLPYNKINENVSIFNTSTPTYNATHQGTDDIQGGSNMTGTDLCVNKPHCAAAVRP